jgi:hypothetical protein
MALGLLLAVAAPVQAAAAASTPPITISVGIGDPCFHGTGPASAVIRLRLTSPERIERGNRRVRSNEAGGFKGCFDVGVDSGNILGAHTHNVARRWQVPDVTVHVDRVTDTVRGRAPAGSALHAEVRRGGNGFEPDGHGSGDGTAAANGRYALDMSSQMDIGAGMVGYLTAQTGGDRVAAVGVALWLVTQQGQANLYGDASDPLHIELRAADGHVRATVDVVTGSGEYRYLALLLDAYGQPVYPAPGDRIVVRGVADADLRIPVGAANGRVGTDVLYGRCMPNVAFDLWGRGQHKGTTNAHGRFSMALPGRPIRRGDGVSLFCHYPSGDIYQINSAVH